MIQTQKLTTLEIMKTVLIIFFSYNNYILSVTKGTKKTRKKKHLQSFDIFFFLTHSFTSI